MSDCDRRCGCMTSNQPAPFSDVWSDGVVRPPLDGAPTEVGALVVYSFKDSATTNPARVRRVGRGEARCHVSSLQGSAAK